MKDTMTFIKGIFVSVGAYFSAKLGALAPILLMLFTVMIIDYISGVVSASINHELNSKIGFRGILKKVSYIITIAVAMCVDKLIFYCCQELSFEISFICAFGTLTTIWLTLNELISIIENLIKIGVPMPKFLINITGKMKDTVENLEERKENK